ncbi:hypothetical protein HDU87_007843 [Geranomyces variabilis]|uniref:Uncharacterized protein n=1 Tax=Geranomyces variabilis TaxID=109894 RepID=A0AAD5XMF8_9FUNG|nr:hypothetical protein HDU87_007843 [Geranomyces variabilis]
MLIEQYIYYFAALAQASMREVADPILAKVAPYAPDVKPAIQAVAQYLPDMTHERKVKTCRIAASVGCLSIATASKSEFTVGAAMTAVSMTIPCSLFLRSFCDFEEGWPYHKEWAEKQAAYDAKQAQEAAAKEAQDEE